MTWQEELLRKARHHLPDISSVHLAILREPFASYVLEGSKTVESRFSKRRARPVGEVSAGDWLLIKTPSGPVVGLCRVTEVWHYAITPESFSDLLAPYASALRIDSSPFWTSRVISGFVSLLRLSEPRRIPPIVCKKRDRRGWVTLMARHPRLDL
jgi:hypothetical protein